MMETIYSLGLSSSEFNALRSEYAREDDAYLRYLLTTGFKTDCE